MSLLEAPPVTTPAVPRGPVTDPRGLSADNVANLTRLTDVDFECPHGTLPLDRTVRCDCWTPESVQALLEHDLPTADPLDKAAREDIAFPRPQSKPTPEPEREPEPAPKQRVGAAWRNGGIAASNHFFPSNPDEEDAVEATTQDPQEMHAWYMAEGARTITNVAMRYGLSHKKVREVFKAAGLTNKPRGGSRNAAASKAARTEVKPPAPAPVAPKPATPVSTYDEAVEQLEAEILEIDAEVEDLDAKRVRLVAARDALRGVC